MGDKIYLESAAEDYKIKSFGVDSVKATSFDVKDKNLGGKEISYHGFDRVKIDPQF